MANRLRVGIVGGGVCGLTCAIALLKEGVDVEVYEAAAKFGEIGAGIGLGPNALRVLDALGVLEDVRAKTEEVSSNGSSDPADGQQKAFHKSSGFFKFISGMEGHDLILDYDAPENVDPGMHRAAFLDALVHHIPPARTHFHKRCVRVLRGAAGGPLTMQFQDGASAQADVVLGADGIKSAVRRFLTDTYDVPVDPYLKFSTTVAYRSLIPMAKAVAAGVQTDFSERPVVFIGKDKHIVVFTLRGGTLLNVVASADTQAVDTDATHFPPATLDVFEDVSLDELLKTYEGWGPDVIKLLSCTANISKWKINLVYPHLKPEQWAKDRVAILGDAAHAMLPNLGAGAGQGIEDAYLLGKLLGNPQTTLANVEDVLGAYAAVRQPRAQKVWDGSKRVANIFQGRVEYEGIKAEELRYWWDYVWNHGVNEDVEKATALLADKGIFQ